MNINILRLIQCIYQHCNAAQMEVFIDMLENHPLEQLVAMTTYNFGCKLTAYPGDEYKNPQNHVDIAVERLINKQDIS
jgi:hypothetical protein